MNYEEAMKKDCGHMKVIEMIDFKCGEIIVVLPRSEHNIGILISVLEGLKQVPILELKQVPIEDAEKVIDHPPFDSDLKYVNLALDPDIKDTTLKEGKVSSQTPLPKEEKKVDCRTTKSKHTPEIMALVTKLRNKEASLKDIRDAIEKEFDVSVSEMSISNWLRKDWGKEDENKLEIEKLDCPNCHNTANVKAHGFYQYDKSRRAWICEGCGKNFLDSKKEVIELHDSNPVKDKIEVKEDPVKKYTPEEIRKAEETERLRKDNEYMEQQKIEYKEEEEKEEKCFYCKEVLTYDNRIGTSEVCNDCASGVEQFEEKK